MGVDILLQWILRIFVLIISQNGKIGHKHRNIYATKLGINTGVIEVATWIVCSEFSYSETWSVVVSSLELLDNSEVFLEGVITFCLCRPQISVPQTLIYLWGLFNYFLSFLNSLEFVNQQYSYTLYKNDGLWIPESWDFLSVLINSINFLYLWYACSRIMSNYPLHSLLKKR